VLSAASIALLTTTLVTVLAFHATAGQPRFRQPAGMSNPVIDRDSQVLLVITVVLVVLAAINAIFTAWTTALDARHQLAVARSLGATPQQVSAGLSAAQLLAAVPGAIVGIPAGIGLFYAASRGGTVTIPPAWWLLTAVLGILLVLAGLTTIPARAGARRPVAEILQSESA
jgi:putative ABC transport system permease protein